MFCLQIIDVNSTSKHVMKKLNFISYCILFMLNAFSDCMLDNVFSSQNFTNLFENKLRVYLFLNARNK